VVKAEPISDDIISIVSSAEESEDAKSHNEEQGWTAEHTAHYLWTRHTKSIRDRVARDVAHFRTIEGKQYAGQVGSYKLTVSELLSVAGANNDIIGANTIAAYMKLIELNSKGVTCTCSTNEVISHIFHFAIPS